MDLDNILDATMNFYGNGDPGEGAPRIIHQEHNPANIKIEESAIQQALSGRAGVWDASEYGITAAEAQAMIDRANTPEAREEVMRQLRERALQRANLDTSTGRVAMFSSGKLPWHILGTHVDRAATGEQSLHFGALAGWGVQKIQQYIDFQDKRIATDCWALVRSDTGAWLSSVGSGFVVVTNEEIVAFASALCGHGAVFETAGALGRGETCWLQANMPELSRKIAGVDEMTANVLFAWPHGYGTIKVLPVAGRTVCANTYAQNTRNNRAGLRFRHTSNVRATMEAALEQLQEAKTQCGVFLDQAEELAATRMPNEMAYFQACLDDILDVTVAGQRVTSKSRDDGTILRAIMEIADVEQRQQSEKRYERALRQRKRMLDDILERYDSERCNGIPEIAGSAWSAANAVSESVQYGPVFRYKETENRTRNESRFESVLGGRSGQATQRAVEIAAQQVGLAV